MKTKKNRVVVIDDAEVVANELHMAIMNHDENEGSIRRIAEVLGLSKWTVYKYLEPGGDRIQMSLRFLHAAVIGTNGDPDARKFLEPDGWTLVRDPKSLNPSKNWEKELGDVTIKAGQLHSVVRDCLQDGRLDPGETVAVKRGIDAIKKELADIEVLVGRGS